MSNIIILQRSSVAQWKLGGFEIGSKSVWSYSNLVLSAVRGSDHKVLYIIARSTPCRMGLVFLADHLPKHFWVLGPFLPTSAIVLSNISPLLHTSTLISGFTLT